MKNRLLKYYICVGIGINQLLPENIPIYINIQKKGLFNTNLKGLVSPQQFKSAHSYKPKQHKPNTHGK